MSSSEASCEPASSLSRQGRDLVLCCDGTNNTVTGNTQDTNVLRLVAYLRAHPSPDRLVYYDPGVGTADAAPPTSMFDWAQRTGQRIAGLASGKGVYDNIGLAYLFLMRNWRGGADRIYCFGFSRGAFTARCVAGLVHLFGVLRPEQEALIPTLIHIYFSQPEANAGRGQRLIQKMRQAIVSRESTSQVDASKAAIYHADARQQLADEIRSLFTTTEGAQAWVHWVGVWDTVESVGMPGPLSMSNPSTATILGKRIRNVRHALSFDEHRWTFEPRLYEEPGDIDNKVTGQTLRQRWFSGVHCDVGGGYPNAEAGMSDEAFRWMIAEVAAELSVPVPPPSSAVRLRHDALWATPWWALAGMSLRNMHPHTDGGLPIAVIPGDPAPAPSKSVWDTPRPAWPVVFASVLALFFMVRSGAHLAKGELRGMLDWSDLAGLAGRFVQFQADTLRSLCGQGLLLAGNAPWDLERHPARVLFWSFWFVVCWSYVVARFSSRAFAWLAGSRDSSSSLPPWRGLGMAPLLAAASAVVELFLLALALFLHAHVHHGVRISLFLAGVAAVAKLLGWLGCAFLLLVRIAIVVRPMR